MHAALRPQGRFFVATSATLAIIAGLVTFSGWYFGARSLIDWFGLGVTMKANPAIATVLVGAALLTTALWPQRTRVIQVLALAASLIGGATLLQHLTGWNLGIDTLIFHEAPNQTGTASPGRMGPPASTSFLLIGIALISLSRGVKRFAVGCSLFVLALATLSLVGYWYGAEVMYTVPRLTGISLQMTLILLALSVGTIVAIPDTGPMRVLFSRDDAGAIAWLLLAAAFAVPLGTGWIRLLGQRLGLYDAAFGSALRTLIEITLLCALSWWAVRAIQQRDRQRLVAEAARESTERRFRSVLDASAVPFNVLGPVYDTNERVIDFEWTYVNPAAATTMGCKAQDLIGRKVSDVLPRSWDEPGLFERYVSVLQCKRIEEFEIHSATNGIEGWFHVVASPLDHHVAVWFADVSVRKRQEIELRRADRRKDEFLATLAHELRNPLAPIRQASLLARKPGLNEAHRQWCHDVIERQLRHMTLLLEDLLDVSRVTRGIFQLRKSVTSIQGIVRSAVETARPLIDSRKHMLHIEMPADERRVNVDGLRMAQVIANLLANAAKYTDVGGSIRLRVNCSGSSLQLSVADTGIGIAAEHVSEIFCMFAQVKGDQERSEGGLGIGLALTKGLVELHGGTIGVESPGPGMGSTFSVELPDVVVSQALCDPQESEPPNLAISRKVLVADDNRDAADSLAMLLSADGHDVRVAHDGTSALRIASEFRPDVALLDIGMPGISGLDVAKAIRESQPESSLLLVAITGWGQQSDRDRSSEAGFDHHLTKPVDYNEVAGLLQPGVRRQRKSRSASAP